MNNPTRDFNEIISVIRKDDPRYARGAYYFLRQALDFGISERREKGELDENSHLTGQQLLESIRLFALDQYGPMARSVLEHWGVKSCQDFGNIVFHLVECQVLGKTEDDCPEDFNNGYDFEKAFDQHYQPTKKRPSKKK